MLSFTLGFPLYSKNCGELLSNFNDTELTIQKYHFSGHPYCVPQNVLNSTSFSNFKGNIPNRKFFPSMKPGQKSRGTKCSLILIPVWCMVNWEPT